jgi:hypothetical protein
LAGLASLIGPRLGSGLTLPVLAVARRLGDAELCGLAVAADGSTIGAMQQPVTAKSDAYGAFLMRLDELVALNEVDGELTSRTRRRLDPRRAGKSAP